MSLNEPQMQALGWIEDGLAGSDPRLASMLNIFSRLAAGEEMPAGEKIRVRRGRPAAHRPRRARRHPRRGIAPPASAPAIPAPGLAAGHAVAVDRHHRRDARRRAGPQHQRPLGALPARPAGQGTPGTATITFGRSFAPGARGRVTSPASRPAHRPRSPPTRPG